VGYDVTREGALRELAALRESLLALTRHIEAGGDGG
jgi:hypothetical protein